MGDRSPRRYKLPPLGVVDQQSEAPGGAFRGARAPSVQTNRPLGLLGRYPSIPSTIHDT